MKSRRILSASVLLLLAGGLSAAEKVTYADQVLPLFKNACLNCHNPDKKKAGLDLSTYQATLAGSDNGKVLESGNPSASLLLKCVKQTEEPKMPPKGDKLSDAEIAVLEKWIQGQLLETATGKAVVASNNVQVAVVSLAKPDGPPPMPTADLPLEPLVRTKTPNSLVALAASPWAPLVAVGGQKQVVLYHTGTLQNLGILPFPEGFPSVLRFSRNGQLLLTGGGLGGKSGKVVLWKVATGERAGEVGNEFDQILGADLSPDQQHVALGGPTKLLKIYATKDGRLEHSLKKHTDWITAVVFSPDGKFLASADRSGGVVVWEGATGKEYVSLPGHKLMVTALAFMPGVLASASEDGKITLWDIKEGKEIRSWNAHAGGVESVEFTPDGRLVSSGRDKLAKVWDQNGKALLTSPEFGDIALRAVLSNERVVAGDWTGQIRVLNFPDSKRIGEITSNPPSIQENLTAADARQAEWKGKLAPLQAAQAAAEAELKKATAAVQAQREEQLAALETRRQQAQAELEAAKAEGPAAPAEKQEAAARKVEEAAKALAEAQKAEPAPLPKELAQAVGQAQAACKAAEGEVAAASEEAQRWQRAQAFMAVHRAKQGLAELTAQFEGSTAAAKEAFAPVESLKGEVAGAEKAVAAAAAAVAAKGEELTRVRADLAVVKKSVADLEAGAAEKAARKVSTQAAVAKTAAEAGENTAALGRKKAEVSALEAAANALAAGTPERGVADAKLNAPRAELARLETAVEVALATQAAAKAAAETAMGEAAAAEAALAKPRELLAPAEARATAAVKAVAEAQAAVKGAEAKLAGLRLKLPATMAAAEAAKAQAEKDAGAAQRKLEGAKAQAERARVEFEARYRAVTPLASS